MIGWLSRWWHEGNGSSENLATAEKELRQAVAAHTDESKRAKSIADSEIKRTTALVERTEERNDAMRAAQDALVRIRGG